MTLFFNHIYKKIGYFKKRVENMKKLFYLQQRCLSIMSFGRKPPHLRKKGFIMALLLISLPLFISCLMVFTSLIFCIRNHDLAQSICIKYTLQTQERIKQGLKLLLRLNPLADQLRLTQKHLEKLYREALKIGDPIAIITLRTKIEIVKQKRQLLDIRQKNILNSTVMYVESGFSSFKQQIMKFDPRYIKKDHRQPIPLAVEGKPKGDIAPSYHPVSNFSVRQTLSFSWKMPLYQFLPKWLKKAFFTNSLSAYDCSATIKKSGWEWKTALTALVF